MAAAAAGCALFVFHAGAGHVRHPGLRALLAASVVLLPAAVIEVALIDPRWWRPTHPRGGCGQAGPG